MPEASMYENDGRAPFENDVWGAWQRTLMKSETKPKPVQNRTHGSLGLRVGRLHRRHVEAALRRTHPISHRPDERNWWR